MKKAATGLTLAVSLAGCGGGGSPTQPTTVGTAAPTPQPTPFTFSVLSGETRNPVVGASVIVAGIATTTDSRGQVSVPPAGVGPASLVDVVADGFLDRQTRVERAAKGNALVLWPRSSPTGLTEEYTGQLVYTSSAIGVEHPFGQEPLARWVAGYGEISVFLGEGFDSSMGRAVDFQVEAANTINSLGVGSLNYVAPFFGNPTQPNRFVLLTIDPNHRFCANGRFGAVTFWRRFGNGEIGAVDIVYCSRRHAEDLNLVIHEFGHSLGLRHSSRRRDVMSGASKLRSRSFDAAESLAVNLMYQRRSGNRFPDNDREAAGGLGRPSVETIVCR